MTSNPEFTDFYERYPEWLTDRSTADLDEFCVHIFGPYRGECENVLKSISSYLREEGYKGAAICSELPDHGQRGSMSWGEKNWWESMNFMHQADAGVFIFLEPHDSRLGESDPSQGLNSSVIAELVFWSHFFAHDKVGTLVLFEGGLEDSMGSLVSGVIEAKGLESQEISSNEIESIKETVLTNCIQWMWESSR